MVNALFLITHGASQLARQAVEVLKSATERSQAESIEEFLLERNRREVNLDSSSYGTII